MASDVHIFHTKVAELFGIEAAVLLENIKYWVDYNEANETNYHDGKYWMYNSAKAFQVQFPYISKKKISTTLKMLVDNGYLMTGNYNSSPYDHTLWYTLTELGKSLYENKHIDVKNKNFDETIKEQLNNYNDIDKDKKNINTNNKPNINSNSAREIDFDEIANLFNEICVFAPKLIRLTDKRKRAIMARNKDVIEFGGWEKYFRHIAESDFLSGRTTNWCANFDWILNISNMTKIIEGNYKNKKQNFPVYTEDELPF